jgi:hypothetical protein|tara:strand:- start:194 stop:622 length:429 start_codon:yes stop_codon:yes gene_type:complete
MIEIIEKLQSTTFQSTALTNARLKYLAKIIQTSEDHVSRIGLGLSISLGEVRNEWKPRELEKEFSIISSSSKGKHLRSKTLFKDDLSLWLGLILQHQNPGDYNSWRTISKLHWERGIELLMEKSLNNGDWIRTINSCFNLPE